MDTMFVDKLISYILSLRRGNEVRFAFPTLHWTILSNGGVDPHDCIIFFIFEPHNPQPVLVAKVPRLPEDGRALQIEYDRLAELWAHLGKEAVFRIPEPIAMVTLEAQPALVISYIHGDSLLRASKKMIWEKPGEVLLLAMDAAVSLRDVLDRTATLLASGERIQTDMASKIEKFKKMYSLTEREEHAVSELVKNVDSISEMATHKVLIQGDFWHGNMIRNSAHGKLMFVDWQYSRWSTDVSLDVYLFLLASALAAVPPSAVEKKAPAAINVLMQWRQEIIPAYLQAFGRPKQYTLMAAQYGMLLCCVEKAVRASMDTGLDQVNDLIWRLLFAELVNLSDGSEFYDGI